MLTRWLPRRNVTLPRPRLSDPAPLVLLVLCGSLFFQGIGSRELWASHEARAAQNAQRMLDDGTWLLPRLYDGQVELQKPPAFYWLVAAVGGLRGSVDAWAVRLPAAVAGTLTVLMVWWHLKQRGRPVAGFVAAAMLAGAVHFTGTARIGRIDVPLACTVAAMMIAGRATLLPSPPGSAGGQALGVRGAGARGKGSHSPGPESAFPPHPQRLSPPRAGGRGEIAVPPVTGRVLVLGLVAGFALLLKGPIGVVLPTAALAVYALTARVPPRRLFIPALAAGTTAVAIALPWYLWANYETDGEFFRVFFLFHHFHRAFGGAALAGHPWWFYLPRFAADFLPWTPLVVAALAGRRWRGDADARFGLVWLAVMVLVLSCSRFKRADYLLPAYAGAAIFVGCVVERWYVARTATARRRATWSFGLVLALLPAWWVAFDHLVTADQEAATAQAPFARTIRTAAPCPEPVLLVRVESHLLAYHLGRPVHTLVEWSDLDAALRSAGPHFVVTRAECLDEVHQHVGPTTVVARSDDANRARRPLVLLRIETRAWPTNPPRD